MDPAVSPLFTSPVLITGYILAFALTATRLAPFTKPYWAWAPKALQAWIPSIVAALAGVIPAFSNVKTWEDFLKAVLVAGVVPMALVGPGASSPHNHPELLPPDGTEGTGIDEKIEQHRLESIRPPPKPPSVPPGMAMLALGLAVMLAGCPRQSDLPAPCDTMTLTELGLECRAKVRADCDRTDTGVVDEKCPTLIACHKRIKAWHDCSSTSSDAGAEAGASGGAQ